MQQPLVWLVLLVIFAGVEGATAGLVSIWFCLGSLAALIAAWLHVSVLAQVIVFALVSVLSMAILRPLSKKWLVPKKVRTNTERLLGMEGVVTSAIRNLAAEGQIKVDGAIWTARSASGQDIPQGTLVRVERIEGVKAIVVPVEEGKGE